MSGRSNDDEDATLGRS